ncbi:FAD/NAD(P)-binding domain-containing protein [Artomyces pyxidatus]|uniref:FAD/NAD(P)-binding domain-containing protein n=1 Tax=Artomyces pyxidatus TaxID=48021 RepID=A0ACB8T457_9AGAM|nr:FAD/NAD(P)-binding domain-containing protein [Artomyces pyxidatus]
MSPSRLPRLRVAICGGGIGGLCLAVALSKYPSIELSLYEAAGRFTEIGAGIMIWSRTWKILESLGLAEEFSKVAHAPPDGSLGIGFDYRRSDTAEEGSRFLLFQLPYGCIRFHRAHFLDVFIRHLPKGVAHFGKRIISYSQPEPAGPITISFSDDTETTCDVLIGCDGIKSTVRGIMFKHLAQLRHDPQLLDYIEPVWSGTVAYRGLIPVSNLSSNGRSHHTLHSPMMYCGKNKHVVSYSISQGTVVNVIAFASDTNQEGSHYSDPWVKDCTQQELLGCYSGWEPEVEQLLRCITHPTKWALHALRPLPTYVSSNVVLVGDAAHAMLPHQGAGAGQAIEDAYVLAALLGEASTTPAVPSAVARALELYQSIRLYRANSVIEGSRESGRMYEFSSEFGQDYAVLAPAIERQWDWLQEASAEEQVERVRLK